MIIDGGETPKSYFYEICDKNYNTHGYGFEMNGFRVHARDARRLGRHIGNLQLPGHTRSELLYRHAYDFRHLKPPEGRVYTIAFHAFEEFCIAREKAQRKLAK